jgi:hypothetical protein
MIDTIIEKLKSAKIRDRAINKKQRSLVIIICFLGSSSLPLPNAPKRSTLIAVDDVSTIEESVDIEEERTQRRIMLRRIFPRTEDEKAALSIVGTTLSYPPAISGAPASFALMKNLPREPAKYAPHPIIMQNIVEITEPF